MHFVKSLSIAGRCACAGDYDITGFEHILLSFGFGDFTVRHARPINHIWDDVGDAKELWAAWFPHRAGGKAVTHRRAKVGNRFHLPAFGDIADGRGDARDLFVAGEAEVDEPLAV